MKQAKKQKQRSKKETEIKTIALPTKKRYLNPILCFVE